VGNEHRLGALHVRVAGHHGIAGCFASLLDKRAGPCGESCDDEIDLRADVEAQVGGDLLVAAAAGVELEAERANALDELDLDEVMNVFGGGMIAHRAPGRFRRVVGGDGVERCAQLRTFSLGENIGGDES
jgi:hypothetical protein